MHRRTKLVPSNSPVKKGGTTMETMDTVGDYVLAEVIGKGGYGMVYKGINRMKGNFVAIKQVTIPRGSMKSQLDSLMMEIDLLKILQHPNIVKYIDHYSDDKTINILLEFIENGSLQSLVKKYGKFPESLVRAYVVQVLEGLCFLHEQGVIHRDIKGANILIGTDGIAKLADFGVAIQLSNIHEGSDSFVGTPYWMAPEIVTLSTSTTACDIWSLGCTIIELLTGAAPYAELPAASALYHIVNDPHPPIPECISGSLSDFLMKCFQKDTKIRESARQLLKHSWLERALDPEVPPKASLKEVRKEIKIYNEALQQVEEEFSTSAYARFRTTSSMMAQFKSKSDTHLAHVMKKASILKEEKKERRRGSDYGRKPINGNGGDRYASQEEVMTKFAATQKQERQQLAAADSTLESSVQPFPSSSPVSPLSSSLSALPTSPSSSSPLPLAQPEGSTETATPTTAEIPNTSQTVESPVVSGSISSVEIPTPEIELPKDKAFSLFDATNKRASTTFQTLNSLTGMGTKILRERYKSWLSTEIVGLIRTIGHGQDQQVAIEACIRLGELFKFDPEERNQLVSSSNGIVTLLKLLENSSTSEPQMLIAILSAINLMIVNNKEILTSFCLFGGALSVLRFSDPRFPLDIRIEAASFASQMCTYATTLHMLIGCKGLPMILTFFDGDYDKSKHLIHVGIECVLAILKTGSLPGSFKYDFTACFAKLGLLDKIADVLVPVKKCKKSSASKEALVSLASILLFFAQSSSCSLEVKNSKLFEVVAVVLQEIKLGMTAAKLLKFIQLLSKQPDTKDLLTELGYIERLIAILKEKKPRKSSLRKKNWIGEIHNQSLQSLVNICSLNRKGFERAVNSDLIQVLKPIAIQPGPLQQYSLVLLCDAVRSKIKTRQQLAEEEVHDIIISLLSDGTFFVEALECIQGWLPFDFEPMSKVFVSDSFVTKLADVFSFSSLPAFSKALEPILQIVTQSQPVNKLLADTEFIPKLLSWYEYATPSDRLYLLKILTSLSQTSLKPKQLAEKYKLVPFIESLSNDSSLLVQNMIRSLEEWFTVVQFTDCDLGGFT